MQAHRFERLSTILLLAAIAVSGCGSPSQTAETPSPQRQTTATALRLARDEPPDDDPGDDATGPETCDDPTTNDPSGNASPDASGIWSPTNDAPIHFHWLIHDFKRSDILPGQVGTVVYDIDGQEATADDVEAIHAAGAIAICYVNVGAFEKRRPDSKQFPSKVIGPKMEGWPENWLLVTKENQPDILPLMQARFVNWCQAKGFDAIEPDNLDAWAPDNIPDDVSKADNLAYDLAIANLAHQLQMSVGLKNVMSDLTTPGCLAKFVDAFDWALSEQCYEKKDCRAYEDSFSAAGKAVFDVEYNRSPDCEDANWYGMNAQRRDRELVGRLEPGYVYRPCIPDDQATW